MIIAGLYLLLGCFASFLSGLLGLGGGLIIVPALMTIFAVFHVVNPQQLMHLAIGTSLACSVVNLISSVKAHHEKKAVNGFVFSVMFPGIMIGALFIGPLIVHVVSSHFLKNLFGIFCLFSAGNMIFGKKSIETQVKFPAKFIMMSWGLLTGALSTMLGIAGGVFTGMFLHYCKMNMRDIIGTTSVICLSLALCGSIGLLFVGWHQANLPRYSTGYIYWPAWLLISLPSLIITPFGAKLAHQLPIEWLKKLFAGVVLIVGLNLLLV